MEAIVLAALALTGAAYLNQDVDQSSINKEGDSIRNGTRLVNATEVTKYKDPQIKKQRHIFDYSQHGINYSMVRGQDLNIANLNEAYKPYSAPRQCPTFSLPEIFDDRADSVSYVEAFSTPAHFNQGGIIPLATSQNTSYTVCIPTKASIKGDRNASLAHHPRVYIQGGEELHKRTAEMKDKMLRAGMATENLKMYPALTGVLNREQNPWGNGGVLQSVFGAEQAWRTKKKGANQAVVMAPVYSERFRK